MTKPVTVEEAKQAIIDNEDREVKRHINFINDNLYNGVVRYVTASNIRVYRRVKKEFISRGFAAERTRWRDDLSLTVSLKEDKSIVDGLLYLLGVLLFMCVMAPLVSIK